MKKRKPTAGERMIESARQALAFAQGKPNHGCVAYVPEEIDVKMIRERISLSQSEFAKLFGLSKRTRGMDSIRPKLGHCEIKLGSSVSCEPTEHRIPRTTYSGPCSSALLILQDLPALAGPAVALCTNFARILSVPQTPESHGWRKNSRRN
jgi:hypothetical protein